MPRGITRARAPAVPSLYGYPRRAAACSMPGAIGWAPALLPSRGGVIAHPKVQSRTSDSARCDWEIEEVAEAALLPVAPTLPPASSIALRSTGSSAVAIFWPYGVERVDLEQKSRRIANDFNGAPYGNRTRLSRLKSRTKSN